MVNEHRFRDVLVRPLGLALVVTALSLGWCDALGALLYQSPDLTQLSGLWLPLRATVGLALLVLLLALPFCAWRRTGASTEPLVTRWVAFCGSLILFTCLAALLDLLPPALRHDGPGRGTLLARALVAVAISAAAYPLLRLAQAELSRRPAPRARWAGVATALPLLLAELFLVLWLLKNRAAGTSMPPLAVVLGIAAAATLLTGLHPVGRRILRTLVIALLPLVLVAPLFVTDEVRTAEPGPAARSAPAGGAPRHVLLLVIDTLRRDALSCYGDSAAAPTPHIDALARRAIRFRDPLSPAPWTVPAVASLMTGLSPVAHQALHAGDRLPDAVSTLAERFRDAGYRTIAVGSNPMLLPAVNLRQGFERYDWYPRSRHDGRSLGAALLRLLLGTRFAPDLSTDQLTTRCLDWYRRHRDEATFVWVHCFDPHIPYLPPPGFGPAGPPPPALRGREAHGLVQRVRTGYAGRTARERAWLRDQYRGEVRYVDASVGRLLEGLRELGIFEDMLLVLTSDHGEEFWEHESFEHGHTLYRELLEVPLLIKPPGWTRGRVVTGSASLEDVAPTLLEATGLDLEPEAFTGRSLAEAWAGPEGSVPLRPLYATGLLYQEEREAITTARYKLIRSKVTGRTELFDRVLDPGEAHDLARDEAALVARLSALLDAAFTDGHGLARRWGLQPGAEGGIDEGARERLRSLGYLD